MPLPASASSTSTVPGVGDLVLDGQIDSQFYPARSFHPSWSFYIGWVGVSTCLLSSICVYTLSRLMRYPPFLKVSQTEPLTLMPTTSLCVCDSHGTHLHSGKFNTSFSENNIASDSAITHRAAGLQQQLEYKIHIFRITSCHSHIAGLALFTLDSKRKKCLTL